MKNIIKLFLILFSISAFAQVPQSGGGSSASSTNVGAGFVEVLYNNTSSTDITSNDHIKFNTLVKQIGTAITPDISTTYTNIANSNSLGRFLLQPNMTYLLEGDCGDINSAGGYMNYRWFNSDTGIEITSGTGGAVINTGNLSNTSASRSMAITSFSPTIATRVELRIQTVNGVTNYGGGFAANRPTARITVISGNLPITGQFAGSGFVNLNNQVFATNVYTNSTNGTYAIPSAGKWLLKYNIQTDGTGVTVVNPMFAITDAVGAVQVGSEKARAGASTVGQGLNAEIEVVTSGAVNYFLVGRAGAASGSSTILSTATAGQSTISWTQLGTTATTGNAFNSLVDATATNTLDNKDKAQTWNWTTSTTQNPLTISAPALTTGTALTVNSSPNTVGIANNGRQLISVGTTSITTPLLVTGSINDYLEVKIKNSSTGVQAQSGFTAEADNGTATTGFAWWGINNSTFNFPTLYNAGVINDVTLVGSGQDLIIANANQTKAIKFQTGKATTPFFNDRMTILNSGNVGIGTITPLSTLDNTGSVGFNITSTAAAAYTVLATDYEIDLTLAGVQAVTLPAVTNTRRVLILRNATSTATKTVTSYTGLDGVATTSIPAFGKITLHTNGTTWLCSDVSIQRLPNVQNFTANGTYTKSVGCKYAIVECVGGGGAAPGALANQGALSSNFGSGGNSGAYVKVMLTSAQIGTSQVVTIGLGGVGNASNLTGSAGTATTLGALISASGGSGGPANVTNSNYPGGLLGVATNSTANGFAITTGTDLGSVNGSFGTSAIVAANTNFFGYKTGDGGDSRFGSGGRGVYSNATASGTATSNGASASANSGGGGAGGLGYGATNTAATGGSGGSGRMIITEYFQ